MNLTWEKAGSLCFLLTIPALMCIYPSLNTPLRGTHSLVTGIDQAIPFIKIFVVPYAIWVGYISISLIYFCFKDSKLAFKTILVFDLGLAACFTIYYFFQTEGPIRPVLTGNGPLTGLLRIIYKIDNPYNSFPSIHVMSSYLLVRALRGSSWKKRRHQWVFGIFSTTITFATLFIKQHMILDVLAAIILVECLFKAVEIIIGWFPAKRKTLKEPAQKPGGFPVKTLH